MAKPVHKNKTAKQRTKAKVQFLTFPVTLGVDTWLAAGLIRKIMACNGFLLTLHKMNCQHQQR